MDLSILIPARNEIFLARTIESILKNATADSEVIVVMDGQWADPPVTQDPRVNIIFHPESIGQRAAVNEAARIAQGKYIMKLDAHCKLAPGFDTELVQNMCYNLTMVPRMYNLHVFDWVCQHCERRTYQGPKLTECRSCGHEAHEMDIVWKHKTNPTSDFMRFDKDLHFQYWRDYKKRPEAEGDIVDQMCCIGACWVMDKERYFELGGLDESHGSWGQIGVEIACKTWLSGGRQVVNKNTWFAHLFRTQPGFKFPYTLTSRQTEAARAYSQDLWLNNKWPKAVRPFEWILEHFRPIPDWHD